MPRGIPASGKRMRRSATKRGPKKKYAQPVKRGRPSMKLVAKRTTVKRGPGRPPGRTTGRPLGRPKKVAPVIDTPNVSQLINIHTAAFLDQFRNFHLETQKSAKEFMEMFSNTVIALGLDEAMLNEEIEEFVEDPTPAEQPNVTTELSGNQDPSQPLNIL